jgi:hypothetical protein
MLDTNAATMMTDCTLNQPIQVIMSTAESLKAQSLPMPLPPHEQVSPRSPLEHDLMLPSKVMAKKTVAFCPSIGKLGQTTSPQKIMVGLPQLITVGSPPKTALPLPKKARKVVFAKTVQFKEMRHIKDFSQEEKEAVWMGVRDYQIIKAIVKTTVIMMMKGERIMEDDEDFCTRGLEFRTRAGSKIRSRNKLRARSAVLNEQDLQSEENFCDPQYIAMACMEESLEGREGAHIRALYDQRVVQEYLEDIRLVLRMFS